jgi:magnesium chelatase subunit D
MPQAQPQSLLQPLPPPPDMEQQEREEEEMEQVEEEEETESEPQDEKDETPEEEEEIDIPLEFMFGVHETPIDPKLMYFNKWTRKGKGRKGFRRFNLERGRFVKAIFPKSSKQGKLAVAATLRAAAPYQKFRRVRAAGTCKEGKLVYVDKSDFRIKRMARKAGSLIIFVVDASGSMALNRMDAAKGAALSLLSEAYKSRDKICLVAFHGDEAEILVPPTKSMALTKNRLEGMPCGGGSPLSHGLVLAMRAGLNAIKVKQDVGRVIIVLLSDGRANVPICVSEGEAFDPNVDPQSKNGEPSRAYLKEEALAVAKKLGALDDFNMLCIDTEDRFVGTGISRDIAKAARGNYFHIIDPGSAAVSQIAKEGVEAAKRG